MKPRKLQKGDMIATISPSWGCVGSNRVRWKYELGKQRLEELGLHVVEAPYSMKGTMYLQNHPEKRAEDVMWAFENPEVKGIICNIGGNDSHRILPYLDGETIRRNPKIFCGYSDVMNLHLFCYQNGLTTFYGDNLLTTIAEQRQWNSYSQEWFQKVLFEDEIIGEINTPKEYSYSPDKHIDKAYEKRYVSCPGYQVIQGSGIVTGTLFGGHGGLMDLDGSREIFLRKEWFSEGIFFFEDIPEFCTLQYLETFLDWMGQKGYLHDLNGMIIGRMRTEKSFEPYAECIREIVGQRYGRADLPILYGVPFGHTSPMCILPYGVQAELIIDKKEFKILESGVIA